MEEGSNKLQLQRSALNALGRTSLKASSQTIAVQIHLTALDAKSEPEPALVAEFDDVLSGEPPEAIKWAFRTWRDQSKYFPAISEIRKLIERWHREQRETAEAEKRRAEREAIDRARREGKLIDFVDVVRQMNQVVATAPEPEHVKRQREFNHRMQRASAAIATLELTEEQIQSRREKERREIQRYREGS